MEGGRLRMADMVEHVRAVAENADLTIVEGAGGLMVPIQQGALMIDFLAELAFPALLVARRSLGTINHTLLSLEALDKRGISPVGVVLSCVSEQSGPEEDFTPGDLGRLVGPVPVVELPHLPWAAREDPGEIARSMSSAFNQDILERWLGT
jgi:dethiobiotin synthetase